MVPRSDRSPGANRQGLVFHRSRSRAETGQSFGREGRSIADIAQSQIRQLATRPRYLLLVPWQRRPMNEVFTARCDLEISRHNKEAMFNLRSTEGFSTIS